MSKITLDNEYRALENLFETKFPLLKVLSYNPPEPNFFDVVFELIDSSTEEVNRAITKKLRTYQLLFHFEKRSAALEYHSNVDGFLEELSSIPCQGRFIKLNDYTMSRIFTTGGGKHAFYCLIEANYHSARTFAQAPKMQEITHVMNGIETTIN